MDSNNIAILISGYLDGELKDEEAARLLQAMEADPVSFDRFVSASFIHSQLLDWMNHQKVQDHAIGAAFAELNGAMGSLGSPSAAVGQGNSSNASNPGRVASAGTMRERPRLPLWGTLAATLLIAAGISTIAYVITSRPLIVGQLTDASNSRWGPSQAGIPVGTLLEGGQELELLQGSAVITFASGAKLLLEGPTKVRLNSTMDVHVIDGQIAARVPRQAIGFTVTSSLARFLDLGTAFTLKIVAEESFELHVFEGLVELRLDKRFGDAARQPARVAEVRAVAFDVASGDVANLHFQEGKQMPF